MNLDEAQRKKVAEWIAQGLKLSDIQTRLASELGVTMTYMDVRLLVDDLKLTPKDAERPKPTHSALTATATLSPAGSPAGGEPEAAAGVKLGVPGAAGVGGVSVSVDALAIPGAMVSGKVTFSNEIKATWHL